MSQVQTQEDKPHCPECGSTSIFFSGWRYRKGYRVRYAVCKNCGRQFGVTRQDLKGEHNG